MKYADHEVKLGIYCRLSVDDGNMAMDSVSIQNQKELLKKYAKEKNWKIIDIYVDDAFENGLSTNFIRDPDIWCFIHSKHLDLSNSKKYAKLYQGFIYVFSYKKGRLITVYSLPDYMYKEALKLSKMN